MTIRWTLICGATSATLSPMYCLKRSLSSCFLILFAELGPAQLDIVQEGVVAVCKLALQLSGGDLGVPGAGREQASDLLVDLLVGDGDAVLGRDRCDHLRLDELLEGFEDLPARLEGGAQQLDLRLLRLEQSDEVAARIGDVIHPDDQLAVGKTNLME